MTGGLGGGGSADGLDASPVEIRTNYDVDVEFYGIVKIYNPVREKFLRRAAGENVAAPDPIDAANTKRPGVDSAKP
jgi:hypothetical protein